LSLAVACGGDDEGPTGPEGNGTVTAAVSGINFSGELSTAAVKVGNTLTFAAATTVSGTTRLFNITLTDATATGDYTFAFGSTNIALYTEQTGSAIATWTTAVQNGTGTLTLTTLTATRAVGTFAFNMQAAPGTGATGNKLVTFGTFDIVISGG
jgi:hypothetical protein